MQKKFLTRIAAVFLLLTSALGGLVLRADAQIACPETLIGLTEIELENARVACEKEIDVQSEILAKKQREGVSLERDIAILNAKIQKEKLSIRARTLAINNIVDNIGVKNRTIKNYSEKIERERESLAQLIRKTEEIDSSSLVEVAFSRKNFSEFFGDLDSFGYITEAIGEALVKIVDAKSATEQEKNTLEVKKDKEVDLRKDQELEKKRIEKNEAERKRILTVTRGQEKEYQKVLNEKKKKAAQIRAALFSLRDSGEIPFGRAFDYANSVSKSTGIRPAFLLAIFQQESNFGKNQGSCYLKDISTGTGVGVKTGNTIAKVMNPSRDVPKFLEITNKLGRDPFKTNVSCPQQIGWGGAMGAAQFIPSTWDMYEQKITAALGGADIPDPWNARDAFMAAGMYLTDLGARPSSYSAEREAACRYFSGKRCGNSSWAATYGNQVMKRAENIQTTMIDPLSV